jgi:hypothetical protein
VLYTVSTYSFEDHRQTSEIRILDIKSGDSTLLINDQNASEPRWLGRGDQIAWLLSGNKGITKLMVGGRNGPEQAWLKYAIGST